MTHSPTSLDRANSLRGEWRAFGAFLRRPRLPEGGPAPVKAGIVALVRLYALDAVLMTILAAIGGLVLLAGADLPDNMLEQTEFTPGWIAAIVLGAPLIEELIFRSWLSGRPGHVIAAALMAAGAALAAAMGAAYVGEQAEMNVALSLIGAAVLAALVLFLLRRRAPMGWFRAIFPGLFWLVTLGFGFMHLFNFEAASLAILLPLTLPQIVAGTLFGYARVHYGLWASIALHAAHNGTAVSLALIAERLGG